ncbi:hypothetical protein ACO2Q8_07940 [Larkinella sp. VNQ87]|uniref:hypothetical protein n=1 Tax=Larkinella sp. VNQ87 TaxID=3400921 RepID=UPI003C0B05CA
MITEQDIRDAGFVPYQYVQVSNRINRETGRYDRKVVVLDNVFVHPNTSLTSDMTMPQGPFIQAYKSYQLEMKKGRIETGDSGKVTFEGRHGALGFPIKTVDQLAKFKAYIETPTII